jgi:two-component system, chemotaxis family, CheB/CheR fusion protein
VSHHPIDQTTSLSSALAFIRMLLEREHSDGGLHLSPPDARHGTRLPFDLMLRSLAEEYGERAICVILSGTGGDSSLGLKAIKGKGGLVIARDPDKAAFAGMPTSAILTGAVDLILPLVRIPVALVRFKLSNGPRPNGGCSG